MKRSVTIRRLGKALRDGSVLRNRTVTTTARPLVAAMTATAKFARYVEAHSLRMGNIEARLPNGNVLRFNARSQDGVASAVWWRGWAGWQPEVAGVWFQLALRAKCVLDIGANSGYYAIVAGLANPDATVVALEPVPENYGDLEANVKLNDVEVVCIPAAACDRVGEVTLARDEGVRNDLRASLVESPARHMATVGVTPIRCQGTTIDTVVAEHGAATVDLVKIDTECAEPLVLTGMRGVLARSRPAMVIEVLTDSVAEAVESTAAEHCYNRFILSEYGPIPTDRIRAYRALQNQLLTALSTDEVMSLAGADIHTDRESANDYRPHHHPSDPSRGCRPWR